MNNKKCLKCLQLKDFSSFYKDKRHKDGLFSWCKDCHNHCCAKYHRTDKFINYQNKYEFNRYKNDIQYRKQSIIRSSLKNAIRLNSIRGKAIDSLGCSIPEFKSYIENKFKEGMSWKNLSLNGWHLDHIKPLSAFNLENDEEYYQACHYTNIQPLWAKENITKGNKF